MLEIMELLWGALSDLKDAFSISQARINEREQSQNIFEHGHVAMWSVCEPRTSHSFLQTLLGKDTNKY